MPPRRCTRPRGILERDLYLHPPGPSACAASLSKLHTENNAAKQGVRSGSKTGGHISGLPFWRLAPWVPPAPAPPSAGLGCCVVLQQTCGLA